MFEFEPDQLIVDEESYEYRNGTWTNTTGMLVSLTRSQRMTMRFFELHGRSPKVEPKVKRRRAPRGKKAEAKAAALRAAIAKATARKR